MTVLLVALGSAGDVHPVLAIARALQARGHPVELLTNPVFGPLAAACGVPWHPVGTHADYEQTASSPTLWHPINGFGVMWRRLLRPAMRPVFERIRALSAKTSCTVVATPVAFGARIAREALRTPLITAYTAATMLRSCENPLTLAHWRVPPWMPRFARHAAWKLLDRYKLEPMVRADLQALRDPLGLPPLRSSVFGDWMHSPDAGCTLFPAWFAGAACDWPRHIVQTGFPLFDDAQEGQEDPALAAFLDTGTPPLVFTLGSAERHGEQFFRAGGRACIRIGHGAVLLGHGAAQAAAPWPGSVLARDYAAFGRLLPRAAALVHHGGIGSCAQAIRAGIPQLVLPRAYDQFDNAMRIETLGVGASMTGTGVTDAGLASALQRLLASGSVKAACAHAARRVDTDAARARVCDLVERLR